MADAWSTKPGERPVKPDIASIIREAQRSTEVRASDRFARAHGRTLFLSRALTPPNSLSPNDNLKCDSFAVRRYGGNPAAVVLFSGRSDWPADTVLQGEPRGRNKSICELLGCGTDGPLSQQLPTRTT